MHAEQVRSYLRSRNRTHRRSSDEDPRRLGLFYKDPRSLPELARACLDLFACSALSRASSMGE